MNNYPCIDVSFVIEGIDFDLEQFTKEMGITPTETRDIDNWPNKIKNNLCIPIELRPRFIWCICKKTENCKRVELPINQIISQLVGKEQILMKYCEKNNLKKGLIITIRAETMELPEIVLSPNIVSYFGHLKVEIGIDIYTYD